MATTTTTRQQPPWAPPAGSTKHPKLKFFNSLTRSKTPFLTRDPEGTRVTWYACGPTVYDDAHLGHARNYVSTDILRRVLRDYFYFDVNFVMNITDVDDKIILRGRQQHLMEEYKIEHRYIDGEVLETVKGAYQVYIRRNLPLINQDNPPPPEKFLDEVHKAYGQVLMGQALEGDGKPGEKEAKIKMHITTTARALQALMGDLKLYTPDAFFAAVQDVMCPMLDEAFGTRIKGDDHAIFTKLTREFESRFFRDMKELNVMDPDEITRVTEYGKEIAEFVDKIVHNKFAYTTSDGSVYFDIQAFEAAGNSYARLEPWNRGDKDLQADGEGALTRKSTEKRSDADFALWKASKPGEPSWPSPWGPGRPGWHIECSAMASAKFGNQMDIHSGGIDLAFPHHDNELAQSEAFWDDGKHGQWVNYFLHIGHLSIQGSKMSKSLKNFTTIRTALDRGDWTPRSLRIIFLLGGWRDGIEITDDLVQAGSGWEDKVDNFFLNVKDATETNDAFKAGTDTTLGAELEAAEAAVYDALCDSFNTPAVMATISSLITKYNAADKSSLQPAHVAAVANFVTRMVNIFGLNGAVSPDSPEIGWVGLDVPEVAKPYIYPLSSMRDRLREIARSKDGVSKAQIEEILAQHSTITDIASPKAAPFARVLRSFQKSAVAAASTLQPADDATKRDIAKEILKLCDRVRDVDLWNLHIYLEDRESAPALVRPVTAALSEARKEREERAKAKAADKLKKDLEAKEKAEKGKLNPVDMFKTDEFEDWDADGLPTRMRGGGEVPKSRSKKLKKDWERQKKAHEAWLINGLKK